MGVAGVALAFHAVCHARAQHAHMRPPELPGAHRCLNGIQQRGGTDLWRNKWRAWDAGCSTSLRETTHRSKDKVLQKPHGAKAGFDERSGSPQQDTIQKQVPEGGVGQRCRQHSMHLALGDDFVVRHAERYVLPPDIPQVQTHEECDEEEDEACRCGGEASHAALGATLCAAPRARCAAVPCNFRTLPACRCEPASAEPRRCKAPQMKLAGALVWYFTAARIVYSLASCLRPVAAAAASHSSSAFTVVASHQNLPAVAPLA